MARRSSHRGHEQAQPELAKEAGEKIAEHYLQMLAQRLSSGSGGGDLFSNTSDLYDVAAAGGSKLKSEVTAAYSLFKSIFPGNYTTIFGDDVYGCMSIPTGSRLSSIYGSDVTFVLDPVGLYKAWRGSVPTFSTTATSNLKRLLTGGPGGHVDLTLGRCSNLLYGILRHIHRGPHYELVSTFDAAAGLPAKVLGALISISVFSSLILSDFDFYRDSTSWEVKVAKFGLSKLSSRLMGLLIDYETKLAVAAVATDEAEAAEAKVALIEEVALQLKPQLLSAAKTDAEEVAKLAIAAADLEANQAADRRVAINGDYTVRARNISLTGSTPVDGDEQGLFGASTIMLNAQGSFPEENGTLVLKASRQGSLTAGPAKVQVVRAAAEGTVIVDAGAIGTVKAQQGLPDLGSRIALTPTGASVNVGPPVGGSAIQLTDEGISISWGMAPAGASIKLSAEGILMNCGLCSFSLTPEGITLQAAENRIALTPAGVQTSALVIENTGQTLGGLAGMMVDINGDGQASIQGALTMIN